MAGKPKSHHALIAVFVLFLIVLTATIFIPNINAAAITKEQVDGVPFVLYWALPLFALVALAMYFSYRGIHASKIKD